MEGQSYVHHQWIQQGDMKTAGQLIIDAQPPHEEEIMANGRANDYLVHDHDGNVPSEADIDQIAAENLIFMARDGQVVTEIIAAGTDENGTVVVAASDGTHIDCAALMHQSGVIAIDDIAHEQDDDAGGYIEEYTETTPQMVTEEVITDDWVQHQGEERVEISAEQIIGSSSQVLLDIEVPLPTVQDEYTALRPYPCDFCSRRFRKKASLMNHMVAHQNDRPHLCKLCGSRYFRRSDLINHLKAHAEAPDPEFDDADFIQFVEQEQHQQRHVNDHYYDQDWTIQPDPIPVKSSRRTQNASGNSSSTSSSTNAARGRISRLKPKEENYTINESLPLHQHEHVERSHSADLDYVECQELQASTAAVKLTQDHSPAHQQHYPIIDDSKPFVCQQCGLAFAREKALLSHTKNHRNDSPFECNQCNEMFWDLPSLQEHQKIHNFEESNSEYDPAEAEETQSESESEHLYGEFYCSECGMCFHRQDLLRRHAKSHKTSPGAEEDEVDISKDHHCCNTCGETFAEALDLLAHAEIHARYPPFKCVLCGESFFEEQTIKRHLQSLHAAEMTPNSCILCGKECRDRKALIKHAWDHSREKCHSCSKCGKNFHNKARLKRHMASHRDKSVTCDVCHEEFPDGRSLSNHRHSHSATASGKLFPCNECGKTFGSRSSQQIHVRIHTGERPYGCRFCWKAFADGGTLRKHERIHTGEKPYACSVCPRAFNQRVVLREHIRSHHSGLDIKRGTYFCSVCTEELGSSGDLIQHLIQHSDMNTALQRQPVTGPRKYKRRRKLKPHEIARLRSESKLNGNGSDIDISDFDMDNVDDLLGIAETTTNDSTTNPNKRSSADEVKFSGNNNNHHMSTAGGSNATLTEDEEGDLDDGEGGREEVTHTSKRYNSMSSNSDRLWQTKLINSNSTEDTYKSMLSNLENTLQTIDTLVVSNSNSVANERKPKYKTDCPTSGTSQRTQQVQIGQNESKYRAEVAPAKPRKKTEKSTKATTRPRMIHTEKSRVSHTDSGSKRRSKTSITHTALASVVLPRGSSTIVDDYEIISPDVHPPNQISSSPLHIKQEHEQQQLHHHHRSGDLYNAELLLEASTLRKEAYEKYNPSIVNDLEEILRSPIKSDQRQRFTSESSTQFLTEQSEEDQNLIKIEPTSPDLREIVSGASGRRSTRSSRLVTANRKYLQFETDVTQLSSTSSSPSSSQKRSATFAASRSKSSKSHHQKESPTSSSKSYLNYSVHTFNSESSASADVSSSFSSISAVVSAADATAAAAANVVPQERKQRYFECEMCSAVFPDRAQLLDHVPIHI